MRVVGVLAIGLLPVLVGLVAAGFSVPIATPHLSRRDLALSAILATTGAALASTVDVTGLGLLLAALPWLWRRRERLRRRQMAEESIILALEALAGASRAGLVLRDALVLARERARGELAERIAEALAREELGASLADGLDAARVGATGRIDAFLADVRLCAAARLGSDRVAALLDDVLGALRFERELRSDLRARTAGQRFQVWLLAAVVPLLALYLSAMSPTLADELSTALGRTVLIPAGALFEIAGILATRRIVTRACA